MITYEEAKKKATSALTGIDSAAEYKTAYLFYRSNPSNRPENNEVVIDKETGEILTMSQWVLTSDDTSNPKKLKF
jgi:hypothetical protein